MFSVVTASFTFKNNIKEYLDILGNRLIHFFRELDENIETTTMSVE